MFKKKTEDGKEPRPKKLNAKQRIIEEFKTGPKSAMKFNLSWDMSYSSKLSKGIADALSANTSLVRLDMSASRIGDAGIADLAEALKVNKKLVILNLGFNELQAASASSLADALEVNTTLDTLRLSGNNFGAPGIKDIARALKVNTTLSKLYLESNKMQDEMAKFLAAGLSENAGLTELYLGSNQIGNPGAKYIAAALRVNTTLKILSLYSNSIGDGGAHDFAEALRENRSLQNLDLYTNGLTIVGGRELQRVMGHGAGLDTHCTDSSIDKTRDYLDGPEFYTEVGELLRRNRFEDLAPIFYDEGVRTVDQASKLTRSQMKSFGNTTLAQRKVLERLFTPKHATTPVGKLLAANGLSEYSKQFYKDGVVEIVALTKADLEEIGVENKEHLEALFTLFNDPSLQTKPTMKMASKAEEDGEVREYELAIPVAQEDVEEDRADQLLKWHKLYEIGAITEKEYAEEKKKIMEA